MSDAGAVALSKLVRVAAHNRQGVSGTERVDSYMRKELDVRADVGAGKTKSGVFTGPERAQVEKSTWRAKGFTEDVTQCEVCGKPELKGTVRMVVVDPDGNESDEMYAGVSCAARRSGRTAQTIRSEAKAADAAEREAHLRWADARSSHMLDVGDRLLAERGLTRNYQTFKVIRALDEYQLESARWLAENPEPQPSAAKARAQRERAYRTKVEQRAQANGQDDPAVADYNATRKPADQVITTIAPTTGEQDALFSAHDHQEVDLSGDDSAVARLEAKMRLIELARNGKGRGSGHDWKHDWIPLNMRAALEKAKGNKSRASRLLGSPDAGDGPDEAPGKGPATRSPKPKRGAKDERSIGELSDAELDDEVASLMDSGDFDNPRMGEIAAEMDARDAHKAKYADERAADEHKASGGKVFRRSTGSPAAREKALRDEYATHVAIQYAAADAATNGNLLSKDGRRANVSPRDLFDRTRRSLKWASEELQRYFAENPRMSYQEFRAGAVGDDVGRAARKRSASRGWESEFA